MAGWRPCERQWLDCPSLATRWRSTMAVSNREVVQPSDDLRAGDYSPHARRKSYRQHCTAWNRGARSAMTQVDGGSASIPIVGLSPEMRIVVKDHVEQRIVDLKGPIVFDEPELAELIHEVADARPRRADHFRQRLLTDLR